MIPEDLKYSKTHEWARLDATANVVTVGITEFAVGQLGDIVYLELPKVGAQLTRETPFGVIESVKAAVDLFAPASGEVSAINESLPDNLDTLSHDPYGRGWMVKIKVAPADALSGLLGAAEYQKLIETEAKH
jgi:glycine cleavage system H protein